jgi:hypothetical protein
MRKKMSSAVVLAAALIILLPPAALTRTTDCSDYDPTSERTYEGTATPQYLLENVVYFTLKTSKGKFEVELAPTEFMEKSGFRLRAGETVAVVGAPAMRGARKVLLAREIARAGRIFVLRDREGMPMWDSKRPIQMDPERADSPLCD